MRLLQGLTSLIFIAMLPLSLIGQTIQIALHDNWRFHQAGQQKSYPASVPGTVQTDLLANQLIEDPFYRTNEKDLQWIDKVDWEYWTELELDENILNKKRIELNFKGLDTHADVFLNGEKILQADNFFREWTVEVRALLKKGKNKLRIYFHSPTTIGLRQLADHGYALPAANDQSENGGIGKKRVSVFVRKPGYHFGWDWGPRLVPSGIWNDIHLTAYDELKIDNLWIRQQSLNDKLARLEAEVEVESFSAGDAELQIMQGEKEMAREKVELLKGKNKLSLPFKIKNPKFWWTHELGEPHLYEFECRLLREDEVLLAQKQKVGLRNLRLIQEEDEKGRSFLFELNGVRLFAKGANYIPNDIFIPRVSDAQYEYVIESAAKANMNMLRVWGGGFYEKDIFYDLCDEKGILVWQDFMFACSMYPGDTSFLASVEQEAIDNIRRLRHHPSMALWCGNNEIDAAWAQFDEEMGWGWKQRYNASQRREIWQAYDSLFHHLLPSLVQEHHPELAYWPSSPFEEKGSHAGYSSTSGDVHYWGVWHGEHPFEDFNNYLGRFMSEYGFQSFPEFKTVQAYTLPEDHDIESEVMAAHQRSGIGNLRIRSYMEDHYEVPEDFERLLYTGQLLQAEGIRQAIEAHRAAMPFCMGSLYWQINDCWPVASWSSMDYYQRWKALHYQVRASFEPLILVVEKEKKKMQIRAVSDLLEKSRGQLRIVLQSFDGKILKSETLKTETAPQSVGLLFEAPLKDWMIEEDNSFLFVQYETKKGIKAEKLHFFLPPKNLQLPSVKKNPIQKVSQGEDHLQIELQSPVLVKNVFLEVEPEGWFDHNYLDLMPGKSYTLRFYPKKEGISLKKKDIKLLMLNK